jgi:hypothetical protein
MMCGCSSEPAPTSLLVHVQTVDNVALRSLTARASVDAKPKAPAHWNNPQLPGLLVVELSAGATTVELTLDGEDEAGRALSVSNSTSLRGHRGEQLQLTLTLEYPSAAADLNPPASTDGGVDTDGAAARPDAGPPDLAPTPCGKATLLADDFTNPDTNSWIDNKDPGSSMSEANGELLLQLAAGSSVAFWKHDSSEFYDLTDSQVAVAVTQPATPADQASTDLVAYADNANLVEIVIDGASLRFKQIVAGATTQMAIAYSATEHRWLRLRESGGTIYWDTSPDGSSWTQHPGLPTQSWATQVRIRLEVSASKAITNPGAAHFASLNGGRPGGEYCLASSLTDAFAPTPDLPPPGWRRTTGYGGCTEAQTDGTVTMTPATAGASKCIYISSRNYRLTESAIAVEVPQVNVGQSNDGQAASMEAVVDSQDRLQVQYKGGNLSFGFYLAGAYSVVTSLPYDAAAHRWWRIRESAGTVYWDTSPDGRKWQSQAQASDPFAVDNLALQLIATAVRNPTQAAAKFADFNLLP